MFHFDNFYPPSVNEVLDPKMKFKPAALKALRAFKRSKPWRGTQGERINKFEKVVADLSAAYGIDAPEMDFTGINLAEDSGSSSYFPAFHAIFLRGRLSVVTLLHEFAHAMGKGEWEASRWSINVFRRIWPKQFAKCRTEGHILRRD